MILRRLQTAGLPFKSHHIGEAGWVFLGQAGTTLGSLFGLKLLTQILPPQVYGRANLLEIAVLFPSWLLFAPVLQAIVRLYAPSRESGGLAPLMHTALSLYWVASCLVTAGGILVIHGGFFDGSNYPPSALYLALLILLSGAWQGLGNGVCHAARLRKRTAVLSILSTWGRPLSAAALIFFYGPSLASVLCGFLVSSLLILPFVFEPVLGILRVERKKTWVHPEMLRKILRYGGPYAAWSLFAWGQMYADRYALQMALGAASVGSYAVAVQVAALPFNLLAAYLVQLTTPIVFERAGFGVEPVRLASGRLVVRWAAWLFIGLGTAAILAYALAGGWIMRLFTHTDYVVPRSVLIVLAAGALAQNLAQLMGTSLLAHNRPGALFLAFFVPGLLSLPLSLLWVRNAGMIGAASANAATSVLFLTLIGWKLRTLVPKSRSSMEPLP